jgi:replicative DNA helicase
VEQELSASANSDFNCDYIERAFLGSLIIDRQSIIYDKTKEFLRSEHFSSPVARCVHEIAVYYIEKGLRAIPSNITLQLSDLVPAVDSDFIDRLVALAVPVDAAIEFGKRVHELHLRRQLVELCQDAIARVKGLSPGASARKEILKAEGELRELAHQSWAECGVEDFKTVLIATIREAESAVKQEGQIFGLSTGLPDLDREMGGLRIGELALLAGRPYMGAEMLAVGIAAEAAMSYRTALDGDGGTARISGAKVMVFSMRTPAIELGRWILSGQTRVPTFKIRRGSMSLEDFEKIVVAAQNLHTVPLFIDPAPSLTVMELRARVQQYHRQHGINLVVVDPLECLTMPNAGTSNARAEVVRQLKNMAKELGIVVIAAQGLRSRKPKNVYNRPNFYELLESGEIDDVADVVVLVHREQFYIERLEPSRSPAETDECFNQRHAEWRDRAERAWNVAEAIVVRPRFGMHGIARLSFEPEARRFSHLVLRDDDIPF